MRTTIAAPGPSMLRSRERLRVCWEKLRIEVRCALRAGEPQQIRQYLQCGNKLVALGAIDDIAAQSRMLQTLLRTAGDPELPSFWRSACLELTALPVRRLRDLLGLNDPLAMQAIEAAVSRCDQRFALVSRRSDDTPG